MKLAVCIPDATADRWVAAFQRERPGVQVTHWRPGQPPADADYACVWAPPREFFQQHAPFKAVFNLGAGVDAILRLPDLPALLKGAPLIRLNDAGMAAQMAEYVTGHIAAHVRGFDQYAAQQRDARWRKRAVEERSAWPVGVMGMGSIGTRVARAIRANGYPTAGWSRTPKRVEAIRVVSGREALDEFLESTRILVLVLPATSETESIINAGALSRLQPNGLLINIGRGALVDDAALVEALDRGHLARAVLDVFREEPLPVEHAFWRHPQITVTPHISGVTLVEPSVAQICAKIDALARGESVDGVVDFERGY